MFSGISQVARETASAVFGVLSISLAVMGLASLPRRATSPVFWKDALTYSSLPAVKS